MWESGVFDVGAPAERTSDAPGRFPRGSLVEVRFATTAANQSEPSTMVSVQLLGLLTIWPETTVGSMETPTGVRLPQCGHISLDL